MNNFFMYLNNIWATYPIEFIILIVSLLGNLLILINKQLPIQFQINKKYNFFKKVKNTICNIDSHIRCDKIIKTSDIKKKLLPELNKSFRLINDDLGLFIFESNNTNITYKLNIGESDNEGESTIVIKITNAFRTGRFGGIKNLNEVLKELQGIINLFSGDKKETENINSQIKIFPKNNLVKKEESIEIKIQNKDYFISCMKEMISIKNKGIPNSENTIYKALNKWKEYFI